MLTSRWRHWLKRWSPRGRGGPGARPRAAGRPAVEALEDRMLLSASIPLNPLTWTALGPAPVTNGQLQGASTGPASGRITGIAADPTDAHTVYVAAAAGGVWKTGDAQDASPQWTPLTDHVTDANGNPVPLFMGALAVAHCSGGNTILYAGTGEADNSPDSFYGRGVLVSMDGGATWALQNASGAFDRLAVSKIAVNPQNPLTVYAALAYAGSNGSSASNTGIWKSTDGGTTWTNTTANAGLTAGVSWSDVAIDPVNPAVLYAAVGAFRGNATNGVYVSTNAGATWARAGNFLGTADLAANGADLGRIALAVAPGAAHQTVYASVANPSTFATEGIFESTNGGTTWSIVMSDGAHVPRTTNYVNYMGNQGWFDQTLGVDPNNANVVYAGGSASSGVIESTDGGTTWADISTGADGQGPHVDHHALAFDVSGKLLDGDDGGLWRLDNPAPANVQWTDLNGNLQTIEFIGTALDPADANIAYGGSQDNGTDEFDDNLGWTQLRAGDGGFVRVDPVSPTTVYHEYQNGLLERSDTGGSPASSWVTITPPGASGRTFFPPYVLDPSNPQRVLYGTAALYQSTNRGTTWAAIGTPGTAGFNPGGAGIDAIAVSADGSTIYVTAGGHNFVTSSDGLSWTNIDVPGFTDGFAALAVDPANAQMAYIARNHFTTGSGGHVWVTVNGGASWTDISGDLPNVPAWSIALDARGTAASRALYLGTDTGAYESTDGGGHWSVFQSGLPNAQVRSLEIAPGLGVLAAGTFGRGLFEIQPGVLAQVIGGVLTVQADNNGDTITLEVDPTNSTLLDVFQSSPESLVGQFPLSSFTSVSVAGGAGNDSLRFDDGGGLPGKPISFDGGGGQDFLGVFDSATGNPLTAITDTASGPAAGTMTLTPATGPAQAITFTNTQVLQQDGVIANLTINLPAGAQGALQDDGNTTNGFSEITATNGTFPVFSFDSPSPALTVHTAGGGSKIQLAAMDPAFSPTSESFTGSAGDAVVFENAGAVPRSASITLGNVTLDLNGLSPVIDGLAGNGTVTNNATGLATLTVGANGGSGTFTGVIQDGSSKVSLAKSGAGTETLGGNNTFSGSTTVSAGTLRLGSATALGPVTNGVTVASGAALDLNGQAVTLATADLSGTGVGGAGALVNGSASGASLAAHVVSTLGTYAVGGTGAILLGGEVQGTLTKLGGNTVTLGGTADNVGLGVVADGGTLLLAKSSSTTPAVHAVGAAGIVVNAGGLVQLGGTGGDQIDDGGGLTLNGGTFDLNGTSETIDSLAGPGGSVLDNATATTSTLTVGGSGTTTFAGTLTDHTSGTGVLALILRGPGTLALTGTSTFSGATTVAGGTLQVDGVLASAVTVNAGATLAGNGSTGPVTVAGALTPGDAAPGVLTTGPLTFAAGSSYNVVLGGTTPGNGSSHYAQVSVPSGTVTIGTGVSLGLAAAAGFTPTAGVGFDILQNDGGQPVGGAFNGLPQGAVISTNFLGSGLTAYLTYVGGISGADVAVVFSPPPLPDLAPGTPQGWSGPLVVATQPNTFTTAAVITTSDTVYAAGGFINQGTAPVNVPYSDQMFLDGEPVATFLFNPPQEVGIIDDVHNVNLGHLAAGSHTVTLNADYQDVLVETNKNNNSQSYTFTVTQPLVFTSSSGTTFTEGSAASFAVTTSGYPPATTSASGALPPGVTFNPGTGVLSGTPAFGSHGTYLLTITASNGVSGDTSETFTLVVNQAVLTGPLNLASLTSIQKGPLTRVGRRRKTGGTYRQTVTITNTSPYVLQGQIALVLGSLRPVKRIRRRVVRQVTLLGASGITEAIDPGSPFVLGPAELTPGAAFGFALTFKMKGAGRPRFSPVALLGYPQP
jgi:autotransporter-associated beta strand protein